MWSLLKSQAYLFALSVTYQKMQNFQGLSESAFIFFGRHDSTRLEANYQLKDDYHPWTPSPLWRKNHLLKTISISIDTDHFSREFVSASFETFPASSRWKLTEKSSKYHKHVKKVIFFNFYDLPPKNRRKCASAFFTGAS